MNDDDRADVQTRDDVERLVRSFYRDAAMDDLLGPIFAAAGVDWPSHINRLTDLWCWQLLGENRLQLHSRSYRLVRRHEHRQRLVAAQLDDAATASLNGVSRKLGEPRGELRSCGVASFLRETRIAADIRN